MRAVLIAALLTAGAASAHDGEVHAPAASAPEVAAKADSGDFPMAFGGPYRLTDQTGATRTEADPGGAMQLIFFGYANCPGICSAALPRMAEIAEVATARGVEVTPVMITVDPGRDTPEGMVAPLAAISPAIVGLTGDEAALAAARRAFHVQLKLLHEDPEYGPIYAHGSHIFLMDAAGGFLTLIPPIVSAERGAEIVAKYAPGA